MNRIFSALLLMSPIALLATVSIVRNRTRIDVKEIVQFLLDILSVLMIISSILMFVIGLNILFP